jgi:hypothetical protein
LGLGLSLFGLVIGLYIRYRNPEFICCYFEMILVGAIIGIVGLIISIIDFTRDDNNS